MPSIAVVFKQEISRLARKEARAILAGARKSSVQSRKAIAELRRVVAKLQSELVELGRRLPKRIHPKDPDEAVESIRFSATRLRSHRKKLGISAADYGRLIGITGHTIYSWEQGKSRPRTKQLALLKSIRGISKREALARIESPGLGKAKGRKKSR